jgi:hypothetical protein
VDITSDLLDKEIAEHCITLFSSRLNSQILSELTACNPMMVHPVHNGHNGSNVSNGHRHELNHPTAVLNPLLRPTQNGNRYELTSPTAMPKADAFLWNQKMMIQVTCRGYAAAQFMQPEPAK